MAKESFYFSHDFSARNDPKLVKVLMKLGQEGKGVYWDLIEMLYEQEGYLLLSECESYAFALRTDENCIARLINDFELFENDGVKFWSNSVLNRINKRIAKSNKARDNANERWKNKDLNANASKNNANALLDECNRNAIKESKVKESKVKESKEPILLVSVEKISTSTKKSKTIEERKFDFQKLIEENKKDYSSQTLNSFFQYWIEKNPDGIKMRFEMEKIFDVNRRLSTWSRNENKFVKNGTNDKNGTRSRTEPTERKEYSKL